MLLSFLLATSTSPIVLKLVGCESSPASPSSCRLKPLQQVTDVYKIHRRWLLYFIWFVSVQENCKLRMSPFGVTFRTQVSKVVERNSPPMADKPDSKGIRGRKPPCLEMGMTRGG